jgi:uncharacterized protein YgfB (UPF0149 family)
MSLPDPADIDLPDHATLARALLAAGAATDPSELHGSLCGYIAGGGRADASDWLQRLHIEAEAAAAADTVLDSLRTATLAQFRAEDFGFEVLLPEDDAPLAERADALVGWCRGFLGGFGLAGTPQGAMSADAAEALEDIGRIAASDLSYDGSESDEDALAEIVEFVRVIPLLLHADCVQAAQRRKRAN